MILRLLLVCFLAGQSLLAQSDTIPSLLAPDRDTVNNAVRGARSTYYNVRVPFSMLETIPGRTHPFTKVDHETQAELPHEEAETIVLGDVVGVQPFLSSDGRGLYTEYSILITAVLKSSIFPLPTVGAQVTLFREGGVARLSDGRVVLHDIRGDITPKLHQQGLFFLTPSARLAGYHYRKFWLIQNGLLKPAFPEDIALGTASTVRDKPVSSVVSRLAAEIDK